MPDTTCDMYVFHTNETVRYRFPTHTNDLIMDRSQAETSEAFLVILEPGEAPPLAAELRDLGALPRPAPVYEPEEPEKPEKIPYKKRGR